MKSKIGLIICLLPIVTLYTVNMGLFWIAIANAFFTGHNQLNTYLSYSSALPTMKEYEKIALGMIEAGASEEEIESIETITIQENPTIVTKCLWIISYSTFFLSIFLLIIGLFGWMK